LSDIEHLRVLEDLEKGDEPSKSLGSDISSRFSRELRSLSSQGFAEEDRRNCLRDFKRETLQAHFDLCNSRCFPGRVMVMAFYVAGFSVLMFPSLDVFLRVIGVLRRAVLG
jgi:hypothetical protein